MTFGVVGLQSSASRWIPSIHTNFRGTPSKATFVEVMAAIADAALQRNAILVAATGKWRKHLLATKWNTTAMAQKTAI